MGCGPSRLVHEFLETSKEENNGQTRTDLGTPSELDTCVTQIENKSGKRVKKILGVVLETGVIVEDGHEKIVAKSWIMEVEFIGVEGLSSFKVLLEDGRFTCDIFTGTPIKDLYNSDSKKPVQAQASNTNQATTVATN